MVFNIGAKRAFLIFLRNVGKRLIFFNRFFIFGRCLWNCWKKLLPKEVKYCRATCSTSAVSSITQIDAVLLAAMADEVYKHFAGSGVNKILTVEASGIALAILVAERFGCNMVFAKKSKALNDDGEMYSAVCPSFTRPGVNTIKVPKEYLGKDDNVLIVDDFLAVGNATTALRSLVSDAGAKLCGISVAVEKGFQGGGDKIRADGIDLLSLAIIDGMKDGSITFRK